MPDPTTLIAFAEQWRDELDLAVDTAKPAVQDAQDNLLGDPGALATLAQQDDTLAEKQAQLAALPDDAPADDRNQLQNAITQLNTEIEELESQIGSQRLQERRIAQATDVQQQLVAKRARIAAAATGADVDALAGELTKLSIRHAAARRRLIAADKQYSDNRAAFDLTQQQLQRLSAELEQAAVLLVAEESQAAEQQTRLEALGQEPLSLLPTRVAAFLAALTDESEDGNDGELEDADDATGSDVDDADDSSETDDDASDTDDSPADADVDVVDEAENETSEDTVDKVLTTALSVAAQAKSRIAADFPADLKSAAQDRAETKLAELHDQVVAATQAHQDVRNHRGATQGTAAAVVALRARFDQASAEFVEYVRDGQSRFALAVALLDTISASPPLTNAERDVLHDTGLTEAERKAAAPDHIWSNLIHWQRAQRILTELTQNPLELLATRETAEEQLVTEMRKQVNETTTLHQRLDTAFAEHGEAEFAEAAGERLVFDAVRGA